MSVRGSRTGEGGGTGGRRRAGSGAGSGRHGRGCRLRQAGCRVGWVQAGAHGRERVNTGGGGGEDV
jgi:hypothetical protein